MGKPASAGTPREVGLLLLGGARCGGESGGDPRGESGESGSGESEAVLPAPAPQRGDALPGMAPPGEPGPCAWLRGVRVGKARNSAAGPLPAMSSCSCCTHCWHACASPPGNG